MEMLVQNLRPCAQKHIHDNHHKTIAIEEYFFKRDRYTALIPSR